MAVRLPIKSNKMRWSAIRRTGSRPWVGLDLAVTFYLLFPHVRREKRLSQIWSKSDLTGQRDYNNVYAVPSRHRFRHVSLRFVSLRFVTLRFVTFRYVTFRYVSFRYLILAYSLDGSRPCLWHRVARTFTSQMYFLYDLCIHCCKFCVSILCM